VYNLCRVHYRLYISSTEHIKTSYYPSQFLFGSVLRYAKHYNTSRCELGLLDIPFIIGNIQMSLLGPTVKMQPARLPLQLIARHNATFVAQRRRQQRHSPVVEVSDEHGLILVNCQTDGHVVLTGFRARQSTVRVDNFLAVLTQYAHAVDSVVVEPAAVAHDELTAVGLYRVTRVDDVIWKDQLPYADLGVMHGGQASFPSLPLSLPLEAGTP